MHLNKKRALAAGALCTKAEARVQAALPELARALMGACRLPCLSTGFTRTRLES